MRILAKILYFSHYHWNKKNIWRHKKYFVQFLYMTSYARDRGPISGLGWTAMGTGPLWGPANIGTGYSSSLNSFLLRINPLEYEDTCLECGQGPHDTPHLFNCPANPTASNPYPLRGPPSSGGVPGSRDRPGRWTHRRQRLEGLQQQQHRVSRGL